MIRSLRYLPIVLLCTALFTGYGAKAQDVSETSVPAKIKGNWALPDCKSYEEAMIITPHFYLKSTPEGSQFWPIAALSRKKDYWVMTVEEEKRPVRLEEDGVLKIGILKAPEKWPQTWDGLLMDSKREYMGCDDIPALLPDPLVRVMSQIDAIETACKLDLPGDCENLLFKMADTNKNKKISTREMKMAGATLAAFAALIENHTVSRNVLDKAVYDSFRESDRLAGSVMPDGHELDYKEFSEFISQVDSAPLRKALNTIGSLFLAFKEAAIVLTPPVY